VNLIHDQRAYERVLKSFVAGGVPASSFISCFARLWKRDGAPIDSHAEAGSQAAAEPGFYGRMDAVNALCEDYTSCLPDGCGYRVSEEQFRKEIERLAGVAASPRAAAVDGASPGMPDA
jgi:hypothetical protein